MNAQITTDLSRDRQLKHCRWPTRAAWTWTLTLKYTRSNEGEALPLMKGEFVTLTWESPTPHLSQDDLHVGTHIQEHCWRSAASSSALHSPSGPQSLVSRSELGGGRGCCSGSRTRRPRGVKAGVNRCWRGWTVCLPDLTAQQVIPPAAGRWPDTSSLPAPRQGGPLAFCWSAPEQVLPVKWAVIRSNTE